MDTPSSSRFGQSTCDAHAIVRGDPEAWERLFGRYRKVVTDFCCKNGFNVSDAEDIGQEAWLSLLRKIATFRRDQSTFKQFFLGIVHDRFVELARRKDAQRRMTESMSARAICVAADPAEQVEQELDHAFETATMSEALARVRQRVTPANFQYFHAHHIDGRPADEIAAQCNVPLATVNSACQRGRAFLQEEIDSIRKSGPYSESS